MSRRSRVVIGVIAIAGASMFSAGCGTAASTASPAAGTASAAPTASVLPKTPANDASSSPAATVADRYREKVADPDARWVADLDGDFITSETATPKRTYLYPVSGVLTFSGIDHHLVLAMAEPKGIHAFEQSSGSSSFLDAIRSGDVEPAGQEMVDGRELTVLRVAEPVEMSAFGTVDLSAGPATGNLEILVDPVGAPVMMRLTSVGTDGELSAETLTLSVQAGDRDVAIPQASDSRPFESERFGYAIEVPDFLKPEVSPDFDNFYSQGYGGIDIRAYDLDGQAPEEFVSGYIDFFANGEAKWGAPTNEEQYLTVGEDGEGGGNIFTFHYEKDGLQRAAIVALFMSGDRIWDVTWRGYADNEIPDRTMLLQVLSTWRFVKG